MRTLVVSDLHLGSRVGTDTLRRPELRVSLLAALADVDRLVLLGDALELRHGPVRDALAVAAPVLAELGAAMAGREVVLVPGNHDHHLAEPWLDRRRRAAAPPPLGLEEAVDWHGDEPLARLAERLGPARLRVAYPGVWLRRDVYALHGHYLDVHFTVPTFERLAAGIMRRLVGAIPEQGATPDDYQLVLSPVYAWLHSMAQQEGERSAGVARQRASSRAWRRLSGESSHRPLRSWALRVGFGVTIATLNRAGIGPLRADVSGEELRRAGLRAIGETVGRLGIAAEHVIFGHTHRSGPWPADDDGEWRAPTGARLWNAGSWVHEPHFVAPGRRQSPYWPGGAVMVEEAGPPRPRRLLADVPPAAFAAPRS